MPEGFSFFVWPQTVRGLVEGGVLAPLHERLAGAPGAPLEELSRALGRLAELERRTIVAAITGDEPWRSLWERAS